MGTDDLFRKRKEQKAADLARKVQARPQGLRYLIVCEGEKTEPNYFHEFCADLRLKTACVRVEPSALGSSPSRVVEYAEKLFNQDGLGGDPFDKVFCVFDRDKHDDFFPAIKHIEQLSAKQKPFEAIVSVPCFEYWLLLHFVNTRQAFHAAGKKSICDSVIRELRKQPGFKQYSKGRKDIYGTVRNNTGTAIDHAEQAEKDAKDTGEDNPSTRIHHLVAQLQKLAGSAKKK